MPNIRAAEKHVRQTNRRQLFNGRVKNAYKTAVKEMRENPTVENLQAAYSKLAKAARKGVIKQGKADRLKSRLSTLIK
ncbi:30S ribosomal protein S20 [candidate division WWE3 bacterium]|uniref:Small ribosomal subunit protein bS20 n=1 Tax=candidate division WWE3 bacterium TaxID=2053526 RepID=A0A955RW28_UNCKA|nr:30S ribosomal protein S20 [candidate division WWE3 bacterium]